MSIIYMLILTASVSGYHEYSIIHTETPYATLQACHKAYDIARQQFLTFDRNDEIYGTCLAVPKQ